MSARIPRLLGPALLALVAGACSGPAEAPAPGGPDPATGGGREVRTPEERPPAEPWEADGVRRVESNAGRYVVEYRSEPTEFPLSEPFRLTVRVLEASTGALVGGETALQVTGWMPDHGHGLSRAPTVRSSGERFEVGGMLLHMPGYWELYLDIRDGPLVERAELHFRLE